MKHAHPSAVRRRRTTVIAVSAFGVVAALVGAGVASAATGPMPDARTAGASTTAQNAPKTLFTEQFEHGVGNTPIGLEDYVGPDGETYTADPYWLDMSQCNGIIINHQGSGTVCDAGLRALADVLGQVGGTDPDTNHAVSAWTGGDDVPANSVQLRSVQPTELDGAGRFISFGVDAAAASCVGFNHPLLNFSLVDGAEEHKVSDGPIDPCTAAGSKRYDVDGQTIMAGSFVSDGGMLFTGDTLKFIMRNAQPSSSGNDGAVDNIRVLDSTPQLVNAFDGSSPIVGDTARLTFTVENTSEDGAKPGWSFTESLPKGLTLASAPNAQTTCANGTVTADGGSSTIGVTGDLASGAAGCTVSVDVTSDTAGTYTVDGSTISAHAGLDLPEATQVTFTAEQNSLAVTDTARISGGNGDDVADLGEDVAFDYHVTNNGDVAVHDLALTSSTGAVTCTVTELAPGASTDCSSAPHAVTQADVDAGSVDDTVDVTATSRSGQTVTADASASAPTTEQAADTGLDLSTVIVGQGKPGVGDTVGLRVVVKNSGNVTLHDLQASIADHSGFTVVCPEDSLAPGDSATCDVTGEYTVTQADVDRGSVSFAASSAATGPKGQHVTADATATQDTVAADPAIAETMTAKLAGSATAKPGDLVNLTVSVRNAGNVTLRDVAASLGEGGPGVSCPITELAPGKSTDCSVTGYALTQGDIDAGTVAFHATAAGTAPDGTGVDATADAGADIDQVATIGTDVTAHLAASEHPVPLAGDVVNAAATVTNTGNVTLHQVRVALADGTELVCDADTLAPGATANCAIADRTLTQDDIEHGTVEYAETATGSAPDGSAVNADDAITVGLTAKSGLFLEATWTPSVSGDLHPGDTIASTYTVTNTSNLVATDTRILDDRMDPATCAETTLAPGASTTCVSDHASTVTDEDGAAGTIELAATAEAQVSRPDGAVSDTGSQDGPSTRTVAADVNESADPVFVFSNEVTKKLTAAPTPIQLAYTGSDVLVIALPIAIVLVLAGIVLWLVMARRRKHTQQ